MLLGLPMPLPHWVASRAQFQLPQTPDFPQKACSNSAAEPPRFLDPPHPPRAPKTTLSMPAAGWVLPYILGLPPQAPALGSVIGCSDKAILKGWAPTISCQTGSRVPRSGRLPAPPLCPENIRLCVRRWPRITNHSAGTPLQTQQGSPTDSQPTRTPPPSRKCPPWRAQRKSTVK